jgi:hypothetical protein
MPDFRIRPRTLKRHCALVGFGAILAAALLIMPPDAHAYPADEPYQPTLTLVGE